MIPLVRPRLSDPAAAGWSSRLASCQMVSYAPDGQGHRIEYEQDRKATLGMEYAIARGMRATKKKKTLSYTYHSIPR